MSIRIFYDETDFRLRGWRKASEIIKEIISGHGNIPGEISIIITNDENLKEINVEFLEHDYYTDVITFAYIEGKVINGEIYISIDRVRENSINYNVSLKSEIMRVIIHGCLHLLGHDDNNKSSRNEMTRLEDLWLSRLQAG